MLQSPHINSAAVLVAALVRFFIGFVWWSPPVFGGPYKTPELQRRMKWAVLATVLTALLMAWVLAHAIAYADARGALHGAVVGFFNWLGFIATVTLMVGFSQPDPAKGWLIQNGYQLLSLLAMGAVLGGWR
jgi:hypothetical protein